MSGGLWPSIRASLDGEFWEPVGTLITANGTMVPNGDGPGFPADVGRFFTDVVDDMWVWRWADYPAATFPMRPSINILKDVLRAMIRDIPGKKVLIGYSQSAIATAEVWRDDILNPGGVLHGQIGDIVAVINYGDPTRTPGVAYGNQLAGRPAPGKLDGYTTGGIAGPGCLKPAECLFPAGHKYAGLPAVFSVANDGDLYASAPVGDTPWVSQTTVGGYETLIFDAIMEFDGQDLMAFTNVIFQLVLMPLAQLIPLVQAIWNGLMFLGQGTNAPHWTYDVGPAIRFLIDIGAQARAAA